MLILGTSVLVKVWWFSVVAIVSVLLYRSAFPPTDDEEAGDAVAHPPSIPSPEPLIDTRPRMTCPRCAELVLVEAQVCRFCGYRLGGPAKL